MPNRFDSFEELRRSKTENKDYRIRVRIASPRILVMAPHGGKIERGTCQLAELIADDDFSFYSFEGTQRRNNYGDLHITSTNFDEPRAIDAASKADIVVTIHGHSDEERSFIMIGGLHEALCEQVRAALTHAGFSVEREDPGLAGLSKSNICNRGRSGMGVQLEISRALRDDLLEDDELESLFVNTVRGVLSSVVA